LADGAADALGGGEIERVLAGFCDTAQVFFGKFDDDGDDLAVLLRVDDHADRGNAADADAAEAHIGADLKAVHAFFEIELNLVGLLEKFPRTEQHNGYYAEQYA